MKKNEVLVKQNDDARMVPYVVQNTGSRTVRFSSGLEEARPDLLEFPEYREILVEPGKRKIIPHDYYRFETIGGGKITMTIHIGTAAPELRNFKLYYRLRYVSRLNDYLTVGEQLGFSKPPKITGQF